ncbi:hypothetical protein ACJIZ3_003961 [Penstemon smallii]|uniref:Uncharacterized protein n=1 Tax=Penstemon smallii TaxID=265156 RepID=A0ABD3S0R6_9LAMI
MVNRRYALAQSSDDEDNAPPSRGGETEKKRKRKKVHIPDDEEEEEEKLSAQKKQKNVKDDEEEEVAEEENENDEEEDEQVAQPLGEVVRVSGKGKGRRNHFRSFEYDGLQYQLEDPVLLVPEIGTLKPYVAIIKDIARTHDGSMMVTGQWFYRPEEAEKKGGGNWQSRDTRELFYSFHRDEVPAESVMHKCVVHFIPLNKKIPLRKEHPGFIVQKVYDTEQRKLFKLTDKDYEDNKQHEIDILVGKTVSRLGDLPDLEPHDTSLDPEEQMKNKRLLRKRNMPPLDISGEEKGFRRSPSLKAETPKNTAGIGPEYFSIMVRFKLLTGNTQRDRWLEKLLQSIQPFCTPVVRKQNDEEERSCSDVKSPSNKNINQNNELSDKTPDGVVSFIWPDEAVPIVAALEKAARAYSDFKYKQKMRQLTYNLTHNAVLARRLLNKELEPEQILKMGPNELKEGLTAEEIASREPEEPGRMQMTDARCKRCSEKQVGITDIIQTGHGDRYQLECIACGNNWYASRDDVSSLTIEGPSSAKAVGTAPLATAKFEDVEKNLTSPRGNSVLEKTTEANVPVLDNQRSFNKTHAAEENPGAATK